jgi:hypothetical protein
MERFGFLHFGQFGGDEFLRMNYLRQGREPSPALAEGEATLHNI